MINHIIDSRWCQETGVFLLDQRSIIIYSISLQRLAATTSAFSYILRNQQSWRGGYNHNRKFYPAGPTGFASIMFWNRFELDLKIDKEIQNQKEVVSKGLKKERLDCLGNLMGLSKD